MMQMGFKVDQQFRQIQQLSKQQQQSLALLACNQLDLGEAIETFLTENIMLERVSDNPDFKDADDLGDVDYRDASHDEADSDFAMGLMWAMILTVLASLI